MIVLQTVNGWLVALMAQLEDECQQESRMAVVRRCPTSGGIQRTNDKNKVGMAQQVVAQLEALMLRHKPVLQKLSDTGDSHVFLSPYNFLAKLAWSKPATIVSALRKKLDGILENGYEFFLFLIFLFLIQTSILNKNKILNKKVKRFIEIL